MVGNCGPLPFAASSMYSSILREANYSRLALEFLATDHIDRNLLKLVTHLDRVRDSLCDPRRKAVEPSDEWESFNNV